MREWLRTFLTAAVRPSPLALATALLLLAAGLWGVQELITPDWYARGGYRYFMLHTNDDGGYTTARAIALADHAPADPAVVIICASATRASIASQEELERRISERVGSPVRVYMLCLGGMTPWEMLALADKVPHGINGVVAIDVGINRFARTDTDVARFFTGGRIGFRSDIAEAEILREGVRVPKRTGNFVIDNAGFFSQRFFAFAKRALVGPADFKPNRQYRPDRVINARQAKLQSEKVRAIQANFDSEFQDNLALLTKTVDLLRSKGAKVVFLETPINPRFLREELDHEAHEHQMARLRAYAAEQGIPFWDPASAANFTEADFFDWAHIRAPAARNRFTFVLADQLARLMQQRPT